MLVKLIAKTEMLTGEDTEYMLSLITNQSHSIVPKYRKGLFCDAMKLGHDSMAEFVDFTFHVTGVSRNLLAQLTRHRIATFNVQSSRHVEPEEFIVPPDLDEITQNDIKEHIKLSKLLYKVLRVRGVKKEDARSILPQSQSVNLFFKINRCSQIFEEKTNMLFVCLWSIFPPKYC